MTRGMRILRTFTSLALLAGMAASCGPAPVAPASPTPPGNLSSQPPGLGATADTSQHSPTSPPSEDAPAATTPTAQPSPTPSRMPLPVLAGTAIPFPEASIRPETMSDLQWLSSIGYGTGYVEGQYGLMLTPDENRLIAFTTAGVAVFAADDLSLIRFIHGPAQHAPPSDGPVRDGAVSRDGSRAAFLGSAGDTPVVRVWDLESGEKVGEFPQTSELAPVAMAISLDGSLLVLALYSGELEVVRLPDGEPVKTITQYAGAVREVLSLVFEPSGKQFFYIFHDIETGLQSVGFDTAAWTVKSFHFVDTIHFDYDYGVFAPTRSDGGGYRYGYFTLGWGSTIRVFDYEKWAPRFDIPLEVPPSTIGISNNSQWIAMGNQATDELDLWKLEQIDGPEMTFPGHGNMIWGTAVTNDGQTVYSVGWDGLLRKWKAGSDVPEREVSGFYPLINDIAFAHGSDNLLLSTHVGSIFEVDPRTGALLRTFADAREARRRYWDRPRESHRHDFHHEVEYLNFGTGFQCQIGLPQDDALVVQTCDRSSIPSVIWTYADAQVARTIPPDPVDGWNELMALSPDGRWLVVRTSNSFAGVYSTYQMDLDGLEAAHVLVRSRFHERMEFSPDGRLLAIPPGCPDGGDVVRVFDVASGDLIQEVHVVAPYGEEGAWSVRFSGDGSRLYALAYDLSVQVFDTSSWTQIASMESIDSADYVMTSAAASPLVAMVSSNSQVYLWDSGQDVLSSPVQLSAGALVMVEDADFSRDERLLAVARSDGLVYVLGIAP